METRANYLLIGAFALAGFIGLLGFLLWFARFELDRQFAYYDVRFTAVSGLSRASEVRFAGLPVGQVVSVGLAPNGDGTVLVRLEVSGDTPVRPDSVATIESMGVTGVSYVAISAGDPAGPLLRDEGGIPELRAGRSVLQSLTEDAPEIITEALAVMQNISGFLGEDNQRMVQDILDNLASSSGNLADTLDDFAAVSQTVAGASQDIAAFTVEMAPMLNTVETTLKTLDSTLESFSELAERLKQTLDEGDATLLAGRGAIDTAQVFIAEDLTSMTRALTDTTADLRAQLELLGSDTRAMIGVFAETGTTATTRLTEAGATLQATDAAIARLMEALDTMEGAATSFDLLVTQDGAALVAETRAMIAGADRAVAAVSGLAETDLPAIVADIRASTATVNQVITDVGAALSDSAGQIDTLTEGAVSAMAQVSETFANANQTLSAINSALATGEKTLVAAERALQGADRIINEDIDAITGDLRRVMARLDGAIGQVSDDIPAITADLRAAAETANRAFADVGRLVTTATPPLRDFATTGLVEYTQLARETRALITSLERLTRQIERDPARFFLNRQTPEFRR